MRILGAFCNSPYFLEKALIFRINAFFVVDLPAKMNNKLKVGIFIDIPCNDIVPLFVHKRFTYPWILSI